MPTRETFTPLLPSGTRSVGFLSFCGEHSRLGHETSTRGGFGAAGADVALQTKRQSARRRNGQAHELAPFYHARIWFL
jgi:hypothetical protein